jgi:hypothetical protein
MQHFVAKTRLPAEELYGMMVRSYSKIVWRVIRREKLWIPLWGIRKNKFRLGFGLLANKRALRNAHQHVAETTTLPGGGPKRAPAAQTPLRGQRCHEQPQGRQPQHIADAVR